MCKEEICGENNDDGIQREEIRVEKNDDNIWREEIRAENNENPCRNARVKLFSR